MKLSYVMAGVLLCGALNADDAASKDVNLGTLTVSSNFKKSILQEPTKVEIAGKDTILENGDIAKSLLNLSGFSMERKGGGGSEVYYRSQTASRLPVLIDGSTLNGGCGMRVWIRPSPTSRRKTTTPCASSKARRTSDTERSSVAVFSSIEIF